MKRADRERVLEALTALEAHASADYEEWQQDLVYGEGYRGREPYDRQEKVVELLAAIRSAITGEQQS